MLYDTNHQPQGGRPGLGRGYACQEQDNGYRLKLKDIELDIDRTQGNVAWDIIGSYPTTLRKEVLAWVARGNKRALCALLIQLGLAVDEFAGVGEGKLSWAYRGNIAIFLKDVDPAADESMRGYLHGIRERLR